MTEPTTTPTRERPPTDRPGFTHDGLIYSGEGPIKVTITGNFYPDGRVCEVFVELEGASSGMHGMANCWAVAFSMALQSGVPLGTLLDKFDHQRFAPEGGTANPKINFAKSVPDYVARWMRLQFCAEKEGVAA